MQSADDPDLRFLVLPYREDELPLRRADLDCGLRSCSGVPSEHAAVLLVVTRRPAVSAADGAASCS